MTTIELDTMLSFTRREHKVSQPFLYYYTDFERAKEILAPEAITFTMTRIDDFPNRKGSVLTNRCYKKALDRLFREQHINEVLYQILTKVSAEPVVIMSGRSILSPDENIGKEIRPDVYVIDFPAEQSGLYWASSSSREGNEADCCLEFSGNWIEEWSSPEPFSCRKCCLREVLYENQAIETIYQDLLQLVCVCSNTDDDNLMKSITAMVGAHLRTMQRYIKEGTQASTKEGRLILIQPQKKETDFVLDNRLPEIEVDGQCCIQLSIPPYVFSGISYNPHTSSSDKAAFQRFLDSTYPHALL